MSRTGDVTKIAQETMDYFDGKVEALRDTLEVGYAEALCELADLAAKTHAEAMGVSLADYHLERAVGSGSSCAKGHGAQYGYVGQPDSEGGPSTGDPNVDVSRCALCDLDAWKSRA